MLPDFLPPGAKKTFRVQQATKSLHGRGEPASQYETPRDFALLMGIFASISLRMSVISILLQGPKTSG